LGTIPLPALDVKPPQPVNPLEEYARVVNLKSALLAQQGQQMQNEQQQLTLQDDQKWRQVMQSPDWDGSPDKLLKMGIKAGVGPTSYRTMQAAMLDAQKKHADLDSTTLDNVQKTNDQYRGRLLSIINAPDAQKQSLWDAEITKEEQAGKIQPGAMTHTYPGDDAAQTFANHFALGSVLAKEAIEDKAAEARKSQADTAASRLNLETPGIQSRNQLSASEAASFGQPTAKDRYVQQQENFRAAQGRQASQSNQLQKNGLEQLDKMFTDPQHGYTQFLAQADATKNSIAQAKDGSELASSLVPLMTVLGVNSFAGVHRVSPSEVAATGPHVGSLYRQLNTILDKVGSGEMNPDTVRETGQIIDGLIAAKHQSLVQGAQLVAKNNGLDPTKTTVMSRDGNIDTLDNVTKKAAPASTSSSAAQVPANVTKALSGVGTGRHTLSDGSVWDKQTDGTIVPVSAGKS
jgi:hypothetical protein